jgi:hypothetical protein
MSGEDVAAIPNCLDQLEFLIAELSANPAEQHVNGAIEGIAITTLGDV